jgi:hypothetical protein
MVLTFEEMMMIIESITWQASAFGDERERERIACVDVFSSRT